MQNRETKIHVLTDGHGVAIEDIDPTKPAPGVKVPLTEENLKRAYRLAYPIADVDSPLVRLEWLDNITPVGLSAEYRMTDKEQQEIKLDDPSLSSEQTAKQLVMLKEEFIDRNKPNSDAMWGIKRLTGLGLKVGMATGTTGLLFREFGSWLNESEMAPYLYEVFLNRQRGNGPTMGKIALVLKCNVDDFIDDSLYTDLCVAVATNTRVHNPHSFEEALTREKMPLPDAIPPTLRQRAIALLDQKGGGRIRFNSGLPDIYDQQKKEHHSPQPPSIGVKIIQKQQEFLKDQYFKSSGKLIFAETMLLLVD